MTVFATVFVVGSGASTTACSNNAATLAHSAFEIDTNANLKVNTTGCVDWLDGSSLRSGVASKNDQPSGTGDDAFGKGTAENDTDPTIVFGSIPPNKSDLKTFGIYSEQGEVSTENPTGKYLALFWGRVQNPSGTTNMDFELNQNVCDPSATPTNCASNIVTLSDGTTKEGVPVRMTGDKLITYDLAKGGTVPAISVRSWTGSAWGTATVISGGNSATALGSINTSAITNAATESDGLGGFDAFTFGEVSLAFSDLFGSGTCGQFGSAYLKSRSSDSFTAEVKDFVSPERVSISNCAGLTTTATTTATVGDAISDTAHLTGVSANATGTITFHLFSDSTCDTEVDTGLDPVDVDGPDDYNSGDVTGITPGTYYWTAEYSGDGSNSSASTECGDDNETTTVNRADSSVSTAQTLVPNDSVTVDPSSATGTADFYLFAPGEDCSDANKASAAYSEEDVSLSSGAASTSNTDDTDTLVGGTHADALGTWKWLVEYSGDDNLNGSDNGCDESFTISE